MSQTWVLLISWLIKCWKRPRWVVGQDVSMGYGPYGTWGKVVNVTSDGVEVQTDGGYLMQFDSNGNELERCRQRRIGLVPPPTFESDKFHYVLYYCAPECQPYHLDDIFKPPPPTYRKPEVKS